MHFTWDISLGQLVVSVPVLGIFLGMVRIYHMMLSFRIEHEYLMQDWAARQNPPVRLSDLPTRQTRWW